MLERIYVEIGNICNLSCSFCVGTKRPKRQMSVEEISLVCEKIKNKTKFIYLHVMGEPLLHPELDKIFDIIRENGLKTCITTNGVLIKEKQSLLLENSDLIHKISISLHSLEGNNFENYDGYLENVTKASKLFAEKGIYVVFRLWNEDSSDGMGKNRENRKIEEFLHNEFRETWMTRPRGFRLIKNVFLEYDGVFTWPTESKAKESEIGFCHGLCDQIAILSDGTVTACCLDSEGKINLGNIFEDDLDNILNGDKATAIREGFLSGKVIDPLCKKCTFLRKFKVRNN